MLTVRELTQNESFDPLTLSKSATFTQTDFYRAWQGSVGRKVRRFVVERQGFALAYAQAFVYPLFHDLTFVYLPYGPVASEWSEEIFASLKKTFQRVGREESAVFIRFDFIPPSYPVKPCGKKAPSWTFRASAFQPRQKIVVPIGKSLEKIVAALHHKTRYNIRLAEKKGVRVERSIENLASYAEAIYTGLKETASRDEFSLHPEIYYRTILKRADEDKNGAVFVARHEDDILGMLFVFIYGDTAYYLLGTSNNKKRELKAPYLLHYKAIEWARERGAIHYNMGGIDLSRRTLRGVTDFKTSWGGNVLQYGPFYDLVMKPFWYLLYCLKKFFN